MLLDPRLDLVPRQLRENGLTTKKAALTIDALRRIIREYNYEAGVRNLEREIGTVFRKIAKRVAIGEVDAKVTISASDLEHCLGPPKVRRDVLDKTDDDQEVVLKGDDIKPEQITDRPKKSGKEGPAAATGKPQKERRPEPKEKEKKEKR